jgi:hypothetical protein
VTDPDVVRRARELVGDAKVYAYTPVEPGTDVPTRIAELQDAGADTVILQGTDAAPDHAPLIAALAG